MMTLDTISEMSRSAAAKARAENKEPLTLEHHDLVSKRDFSLWGRKVPYLGPYLPPGWTRFDMRGWYPGEQRPHGVYFGDNEGYGAFMVDATSMGRPGEPALTMNELMAEMRPTFGYAIVEQGQFQVKIGVFVNIK